MDDDFIRTFGDRYKKSKERRNDALDRYDAAMSGVLDQSRDGGSDADWERYKKEKGYRYGPEVMM